MERRFCKQCWKELLLENFRWPWQWKDRVFCDKKCYTEFKKTVRHSVEYKKKMSEKLKWRKITWVDKILETKLKNKKPKKKRSKIKYLRWYINELLEYSRWRAKVFERDKFTCMKCWQVWWKLSAHHIKHVKNIMEDNNIKNIKDAKECSELWDLNNWITLCSECHKLEHKHRKHPEKAIKGGKTRAKKIKK